MADLKNENGSLNERFATFICKFIYKNKTNLFDLNYCNGSFACFYQMWYGRSQEGVPQLQQRLVLDVVWVVPGDIRKYYLQDELRTDRLEAEVYLKWSANIGFKNRVKIVLENGYSCNAPACLLVAFSDIFRKLISSQATPEILSSGKEITVHLYGMPNITNAGLYNVVAFIQSGQIKFLETELENVLIAANDLRVTSLVSLICEEMTARILENTSPPISLLYSAIACLAPQSQYRNMVVDGAAIKFHDILANPEFLKLSFEMLYALISSPVLQGPEWVSEIYEAIIFWLQNNPEHICYAPALLDNVNFKEIIHVADNRQEIMKKSLDVPDLGPIVQLFLMDAIYAKFVDHLTSPQNRNQSLSSSIYTVSGAETAIAPDPLRGTLGLASSPLGSYIIPPFDSVSSVTTRSISNETSVSVDKNWRPAQQLPIGSGSSRNRTARNDPILTYSNVPITTSDAAANDDTAGAIGGGAAGIDTTDCGVIDGDTIRDGVITDSTIGNGAIDGTVGGGAIGGGSGEQERSGAAITSFPTLESAEIRTSSSQESASNLKRRPKFEQIPLRTEPPKSRKELRKERQAREKTDTK
uniref:BACK domain-containing protein n=2 Tax=Brugia malayi TaxID=6279 RepID=A8PH48_BRUMA